MVPALSLPIFEQYPVSRFGRFGENPGFADQSKAILPCHLIEEGVLISGNNETACSCRGQQGMDEGDQRRQGELDIMPGKVTSVMGGALAVGEKGGIADDGVELWAMIP